MVQGMTRVHMRTPSNNYSNTEPKCTYIHTMENGEYKYYFI